MNLQQAALAIQWGAKDFQLRPCCPLCRGLETKGHKPDCVIGLALEPMDWAAYVKVANQPNVHEVLQGFAEDPTGDNGVMVVRTVLEACPSCQLNPCAACTPGCGDRLPNDGDGLIYEHFSKRADPQGHEKAVRTSLDALDEALLASTPRSWRQHAGLPEHYPLYTPTHVEKAMEACIVEVGLVLGATRRKMEQYKQEADSLWRVRKPPERIRTSERAPERGLIVKGWDSGAVWAGYCDGSPKAASCDWWMPIPRGTGAVPPEVKPWPYPPIR